MLNLNELRILCRQSVSDKTDFRTLMLTSVKYESNELEVIFYNSGSSLSKFRTALNNAESRYHDEERGLIEIFKKEADPNILHLIRYVCENVIPLTIELQDAGFDIRQLKSEIDLQIKRHRKNSLFDKFSQGSPLLNLSRFRNN